MATRLPIITAAQFKIYRDCVSQTGSLWPLEAMAEKLAISHTRAESILGEIQRATPPEHEPTELTIDKMHALHMYDVQVLQGFVSILKSIGEYAGAGNRRIINPKSLLRIRKMDLFAMAKIIAENGKYVFEEQLLSKKQSVEKALQPVGLGARYVDIGNAMLMHFDEMCEALNLVFLHEQSSGSHDRSWLKRTYLRAATYLLGTTWKKDNLINLLSSDMSNVMKELMGRNVPQAGREAPRIHVRDFLRRQGMSSREVRYVLGR